nr:XrtB/PEP-CTERM-associated transcriptional regulator EpsA [Candidatus Accumulibacter phosphatis]
MRGSLSIANHFKLLVWLQGDVQRIIPHDALISYSGAIGSENGHYDVVSSMPGMRTSKLPRDKISKLGLNAYQQWITAGTTVASAAVPDDLGNDSREGGCPAATASMKYSLFHGIHDARFKLDHFYILLRQTGEFTENEQRLFELLLPHVDAAVSRIESLQTRRPALAPLAYMLPESLNAAGLSSRELEILQWVRQGKTNLEIGMILGISGFTVKNHLKRIFDKFNVSNRAQAVGKLEQVIRQGASPVLTAE